MDSIVVEDWAALAAGLESRQDWQAWASAPCPAPLGEPEALPAVEAMAPMLRRRMGLTGRLACAAAYGVDGPEDASEPPQAAMLAQRPMVFASRYGDAPRALELLAELVEQHAVSPTGFALGVHNAIGALYAIARGATANMQVVAAGAQTVQAGMLEALGLLADGAPEVLLVSYDTLLPAPYVCFHDQPVSAHAWAWRLRRAGAGDAAQAITMRWAGGTQAGAASPVGVADPASPVANASVNVLWQFLRLEAARAGGSAPPQELWL